MVGLALRRWLTFALLPVLALAVVPSAAVAEGPTDGTCDESGLLVCAGANAGGFVDCFFESPTSIGCDWTRGFIWAAFSPAGLPGESEATATATLTECVDQDCTTSATTFVIAPCAWLPAMECVDDGGDAGTVPARELEMGQCLKVEVDVEIVVTARVVSSALTVSTVSFSNSGGDAGQECVLDDGRGD